jgi:TolB-like protein/DNA-binding winged helix-turn-helix (wHTH) protein/TPR repeat protein
MESFLNTNQVLTERFRIGDLELDTGTVSIHRAANSIDLPKLSFDLLLCLTRHAPNVVDTDTLMDEVWGKVVIGEETVKQRVKLLRKALEDSSSEPKYIASVRGRGYRLIAAVERLPDRTPARPVTGRRHRWGLIAVIILMMVLGGGLLTRVEWSGNKSLPAATDQNQTVRRIAVLPFENFSRKSEDEYLAEGITEDITTALAQIDGLRVISRTSAMRYKTSGLRVVDIAQELGVGTVLEGSVQRFGNELRITVQMIDALSEEHYWAQTYDISLSKLGELQVGIARGVAQSLEATISNTGIEALQRNSTEVPEAYDAYLKGRVYYRRWNSQDNETALAFYQQAIVLDPDFALAHAGIANTYALRATRYGAGDEWTEKSIQQAQLALSINPLLPEAYKALGITSVHYGFYQESLNYYLKAVELNPGYDEALFNIAEIYQQQGHWDEAVRYQMRDSERADGAERLSIYLREMQFFDEADKLWERSSADIPISFFTEASISLRYLLAGDLDLARIHSQRMRVSFPGFAFSWQRASEIEQAAGNWDAAQEYIEQAVALTDGSPSYPKLLLAHMLERRGETQAAAALLDEFERATLDIINSGHEGWFLRWSMAYVQVLRGNIEEALSWYEQAVEAGRRRYEWDEQEPAFAPLRNEPRFQAALEKQRQYRQQMHARVAVMMNSRSM